MLEDINRRCNCGLTVDFVLVTGDLAFSGEKSQYDLVAAFFPELAATIGLPCDMIFCVPGNHDVQRDRHKTCFAGARQQLQSENDVYAFLADVEERKTLLTRQENFFRFQESSFPGQKRERTDDDLGYVSSFEIEDFRIAIMGLNSAWLSEGGSADDRQLLLGERQVTNAIEIAKRAVPHAIIGMQHHPFDLLRRFDERPTQRLLEKACHFLHCGHLHEPQACDVAIHLGHCLTLAAGASFESRISRNAYTAITFDPLLASTEVTFVQYDPTEGTFSYESKRCYRHEIAAAARCTAGELAGAIEVYCPDAIDVSHYLALLLLGDMSEVPIRTNGIMSFGTIDLLKRQPDSDLTAATTSFLTVARAIKLLHGRKPLNAIFADHGGPLVSYVARLRTLCGTEAGLSEQLTMRNNDASSLAGADTAEPFGHTLRLLDDLLAEGAWDRLRELAERSCALDDAAAVCKAKRMLALCLARSTEQADRDRATNLYRELTASAYAKASDWAGLATLLTDDGDHEQAKVAVMQGISSFPQKADGFTQIGMKIVAATGDIAFRDQLRPCRTEGKTT